MSTQYKTYTLDSKDLFVKSIDTFTTLEQVHKHADETFGKNKRISSIHYMKIIAGKVVQTKQLLPFFWTRR